MKGSSLSGHSEESGSEDDSEVLFQGLAPITPELLLKHYHPDQHASRLTSYVWRCHHTPTAQVHAQFQEEHHPQLAEPAISTLYPNSSFINIGNVSEQLQKNKDIPLPRIPPTPKNLLQILDGLFESKGCIPNLERFLIQ